MLHDHNEDGSPRTNADYARDYKRRGWKPIPLKPNDKAPESSGWQRQDVPDDRIDDVFTEGKNIGLILGPASGNLIDVDLDDPSTVRLARHFLPDTGLKFGRVSKPDSHWLYQVEDGATLRRTIFQDPDGALLAELRGEGHQTMVPASMHPHGERLEGSNFGDPATVTVEELTKRVGWLSGTAMMGRHWREWDHKRHNITLALSGGLLRAGLPLPEVKNFVKAICIVGNEGDWDDREKAVDSTFEALQDPDKEVTGFPSLSELIGNQYVTKLVEWLRLPSAADRIPNTDHGNALRFAAANEDRLKYVPDWGQWLVWDSTRWKPDKTEHAYEYARDVPRMILDDVEKEGDEDKSAALKKWSAASQNVQRLNAIVRIARTDRRLIVDSNALDNEPWLFNVPNGTVNLMTGGITPHDPRVMGTKVSPTPYDPAAECPRWLAFLNTALKGDQDVIDAVQRLVGYSLTGLTIEQVFVLMWGEPGGGKSTFVETLRRIFGDYAVNTETDTFTAKPRSGRATPELARLQGARLVTASESEQGDRLAIARLKHVTGGEPLTASNLYAPPFEFIPTFKLWFSTNHKPQIPADEGGVWDRMILIPFDGPDMRNSPDRIRNMAAHLTPELPGILAWAVEGALAWRRDGLNIPDKLKAAKAAYRAESDVLTDFLEDMTKEGEGLKAPVRETHRQYKAWARANGHNPLKEREFRQKMEKRGFFSEVQNTGAFWIGLGLVEVHDGAPNTRHPFGQP